MSASHRFDVGFENHRCIVLLLGRESKQEDINDRLTQVTVVNCLDELQEALTIFGFPIETLTINVYTRLSSSRKEEF